jgi:putative toxin-antitoxin system antitoxin component (TIGR02293 family)
MPTSERGRPRPSAPDKPLRDTPKQRSRSITSEVLGVETGDRIRVIEAVERGFESSAVTRLAGTFEISEGDVLDPADFPRSTFSRRKKQKKRLTSNESDRLYRVTRLFGRAVEVLGDESVAQQWMHTPKRALGGVSPLVMARTDAGAQEVEDLLGRIEYDIPS